MGELVVMVDPLEPALRLELFWFSAFVCASGLPLVMASPRLWDLTGGV